MPTNTNYNPQGSATPAPGGYAQPSPGVTEQIVTIGDVSGNALATSLAASGVANLQTANYRDSVITVQAAAATTGPAAAAVLATVTPGTAGLWEIFAEVSITGTSVVAAESNNVALYQTATARLNPIPMPATTAGVNPPVAIGPVVLNLSGADTVNIKALATATATAIYAASIIARRVG
jgi:hypothetical protein